METTTTDRNPLGHEAVEFEVDLLLDLHGALFAYDPTASDLGDYDEGPTCSICDATGHGYPGGGPCPLESPDPAYYADEMAAGR